MKMMKFTNDDGDYFEGATATDVVRQMSGGKLTESKSLGSYRRATARRIKDMHELTIDSTSDNLFLKSLVDQGLLESVD